MIPVHSKFLSDGQKCFAAQIEEFGNSAQAATPNATIRDSIFRAVYTPFQDAIKTGEPNVRGAAFWQWVYSAGLNISYSDASYAV